MVNLVFGICTCALIGIVLKFVYNCYQLRQKDAKRMPQHPNVNWVPRENEEVQIRKYKDSDDDALCILETLCTQDNMFAVYDQNGFRYKTQLFGPKGVLSVAEAVLSGESSRIVGVTCMNILDVNVKTPNDDSRETIQKLSLGYTYQSRTHPNYRGRQINYQVRFKGLEHLATQGVEFVSSTVILGNSASEAALKKVINGKKLVCSSEYYYWSVLLFKKYDLSQPPGVRIQSANMVKAQSLLESTISRQFDVYTSDVTPIFESDTWKGTYYIEDPESKSFACIHLYCPNIQWSFGYVKLSLWTLIKICGWVLGSNRIPCSPGSQWRGAFTFGMDVQGPKGEQYLKLLFRHVSNITIDFGGHLLVTPYSPESMKISLPSILPWPHDLTTKAGIYIYENSAYHSSTSPTNASPSGPSITLARLQNSSVWHDPRLA